MLYHYRSFTIEFLRWAVKNINWTSNFMSSVKKNTSGIFRDIRQLLSIIVTRLRTLIYNHALGKEEITAESDARWIAPASSPDAQRVSQ